MTIRPAPPIDYQDAHYNQIVQETNNNQIVAGRGLAVHRTSNGTHISVVGELDATRMINRGTFDINASYNPNDVVFVDPNVVYTDATGSVIPFTAPSGSTTPAISPGLFVCSYFVPSAGQDDTFLTSYVAPAYAAAGQTITTDIADSHRHYSFNVYYPVYPLIPSSSVTYASESTWTTIANQTYWLPLAPMVQMPICIGGVQSTAYVNAVVSGSVFNMGQLPYNP